MGKVQYATGIEYVSGSLAKPTKKDGHSHGTYLIGTHRKAASQNPVCTRIYVRNQDTYKRSTPLNANEMAARTRFTTVRAQVYARAHNLSTMSSDQAAFVAQKDLAGGKKTFNAYLWKVCGDAYDAQQG